MRLSVVNRSAFAALSRGRAPFSILLAPMSHSSSEIRRETVLAIGVAAVIALLVNVGWSRVRNRTPRCCATLAPEALLPVDRDVRVGTLRNGLTYYIRVRHVPEHTAELRLVVNAGSVLESDDQRGLAHAVEHMAFRGTTNFPGRGIVDYFESIGMRSGQDLNAYTGFDETVYRLSLPTQKPKALEQGIRVLADWAQATTFDTLAARQESGVVMSEWRSGRDAGRRLTEARDAALLGGSRYAVRLPIGDTGVLRRFDVVAMRRFYHDWYRPNLMAVVVVGDIEPSDALVLLRKHFGGFRSPREAPVRPTFALEQRERARVVRLSDPEATDIRVALWRMRPHRSPRTVGDYRAGLIEALLVAMLDARLGELAGQPSAPVLSATAERRSLTRTVDADVLRARVPDGGAVGGVEALVLEGVRAARHGFTATELDRQKAVLLHAAEDEYEGAGRSASDLASAYVEHFLGASPMLPRDEGFELRQRLLPSITLEDVAQLARAWASDSDRVIVVSAPERLATTLPSDTALLAAVATAARRQVTPYVDVAATTPLLERQPDPGRIISEKTYRDLGTIEWVLGNGMRVLVKPTRFVTDEVLVDAWGPGGASLAPTESFVSSWLSDRIVQATGVGPLDGSQLAKRLVPSSASIAPRVETIEVGVGGSAAPRDLEQLFQLMYLYFTAPREDSTAFRAYVAHARELARGRVANPDAAFDDTIAVTLTSHDPRARPISPALYGATDLRTAISFYRARFANAGNFTAAIIGDFSLERVRPLVERYLASLPAGHRESARDVDAHYPNGVVERVFRAGVGPKSQTRLVLTGPVTLDQPTSQALRSVRDLLQLRLEARLRETLGGTYDLSTDLDLREGPRPEYALSVDFTAAPDRVDTLARETLAEILRLREQGPSPAELEKLTAAQHRDLEGALEDNGYWLSELRSHSRLGWPLEDILQHDSLVSRQTTATVQEAARKYLDIHRYVRVTRYPLTSAIARPPSSSQ